MYLILAIIARTEAGRWHPGIGDPTFLGWFTVFAYAGAAYLCLRSARLMRGEGERRRTLRTAWLALSISMGALAVNKQLDLQSLLTYIGKDMAMQQGWYDQRHVVQRWFIAIIVASSVLVGAGLAWWMRRELRHLWLAGLGTVFIVAFVLVRASSFHHVDLFLRGRPGEVRMNWVLELSGIACVALGAFRFERRIRRR